MVGWMESGQWRGVHCAAGQTRVPKRQVKWGGAFWYALRRGPAHRGVVVGTLFEGPLGFHAVNCPAPSEPSKLEKVLCALPVQSPLQEIVI